MILLKHGIQKIKQMNKHNKRKTDSLIHRKKQNKTKQVISKRRGVEEW